ncbi:MAG: hypothetical protein WC374_03240 [Phycisphaerae bacterium]
MLTIPQSRALGAKYRPSRTTRAYDAAAKQVHKEFARLDFPQRISEKSV